MKKSIRRGALTIAVVATFTAACGGGGSDGEKGADTTAGTVATTTSEAATTTAADTTSTQPALSGTAKTEAAALTAADLGGDWKVYDGEVAEDTGTGEPCEQIAKADDAATALTESKILQRGSGTKFARTTSMEFTDEAGASAFVEAFLSDETIECGRKGFEDDSTGKEEASVTTEGVERRTDDGTFRGQYAYYFHEQVDGQDAVTAVTTHLVYQKGNVVIDLFLEYAGNEGDPEDLYTTVYTEGADALEKVLQRA